MFEEDLSVYTDAENGGVLAVIGATTLYGTFDRDYAEVTINGVPVSGEVPIFGCAEADLPAYTHGTAITVNSTSYKIQEWKADGTGWVNLILEEQ